MGEVETEEKTTAVGGRVPQGQRQRRRPRGSDASVVEVALYAGAALHDAARTAYDRSIDARGPARRIVYAQDKKQKSRQEGRAD